MNEIRQFWQIRTGKIFISVFALITLCCACQSLVLLIRPPSRAADSPTPAVIPLAQKTPTEAATQTPWIITQIVTQTFTATPQYTPTITFTSTITNTPLPPTATPNREQTSTAQALQELRSDKEDGFYLVNVDIAPGIWRSDGTVDSCYWGVTKPNGDIIDNHFGQAGGTAYIPPNAFQVEFNGCGTWVFISTP